MFKPHTSALFSVRKGIHGNAKQFLAFETLFNICLSIPCTIQIKYQYKMLKQQVKSCAIEIDYK